MHTAECVAYVRVREPSIKNESVAHTLLGQTTFSDFYDGVTKVIGAQRLAELVADFVDLEPTLKRRKSKPKLKPADPTDDDASPTTTSSSSSSSSPPTASAPHPRPLKEKIRPPREPFRLDTPAPDIEGLKQMLVQVAEQVRKMEEAKASQSAIGAQPSPPESASSAAAESMDTTVDRQEAEPSSAAVADESPATDTDDTREEAEESQSDSESEGMQVAESDSEDESDSTTQPLPPPKGHKGRKITLWTPERAALFESIYERLDPEKRTAREIRDAMMLEGTQLEVTQVANYLQKNKHRYHRSTLRPQKTIAKR